MSIPLPDQLVFRGRDSKEGEDFIFAVRRYAYSQGKQNDNAWIVSFASQCFAGDALRWLLNLDEATQNDWKLLQDAILSRFRPDFHGVDGEECESLVRSVDRLAADKGREDDNEWIAKSALSCFAGDALRWSSTLDGDVRRDWRLLRSALFAKYPRGSESNLPSPPAAPPTPDNTCIKTKYKGRIRVDCQHNIAHSGYFSRIVGDTTKIQITKNSENAMTGEVIPWRGRYRLKLLNAVASQPMSLPLSNLQWLGLLWQTGPPPKKHTDDAKANWAWLCPATDSVLAEHTGQKTYRGPAVINLICDGWFTIQLPFLLDEHAIYTMDIRLTTDANGFLWADPHGSVPSRVRLTLE